MKIFPAKGGGDPVTVTTRPGVCASDVIRLLHERAGNKFDLDAALQRSESLQDQTRAELKDARAAFYDEVWVDPLEAESDAYIVPREGMTFGRIAADIREQFRQQLSAADLIRWNPSVSGQRVTKNARFKQGTRIWYIVQ